MVLDSACAMIVPLIIFVPYLAAFDREMMSFRREDLYNAPWFINMIRENRMLYAMSNVDLVSKLIPHLSIWGCTRTIKASIRRKPRAQITSTEGEACDASSSTTRQSTLATFFHWWRHRKHERHQTRLEKFVHVFFIGWGLAILGAHLQAAHVATSQRDHACIQELRPWLTNTFACATYQFNCATTGVQTVTSADLEVLHATSLAGLIITNCPALEMPDTIQSFSQMIGIVIYNSSVAAWPASAAVTAATHDELVCIIAVRTNFSAIPEGMLQSLPHTIQDIQIAVSNLTRLPDGVHEHWVALSTIVLEYCAFTDFPIELLQIHLDRLSLIGSPIRELPDVFSTAMFGFVGFGISYNPWLSTLPASGFFPQLQGIIIEATNVSELPAWAWASNSSTRIFAINTPFCAAHGNLTGKIECVQRDFEGQGFYPLAVADALYA
ncbi:TPA: hypothetical protein N0F65_007760 [Lagenidium giganteum]|uniref:Uncharacterized protein n=1 Tax=Lagenidium giganteum TaxID=4803 RepID=A0AAV2YJT4_9STRA|nr:TPA: hypothetical protein N0F65_007760 [Lagenidium giganteum]